MVNRNMLYNIIYALAARNGRQESLFGNCAPLAQQAFEHSLAGKDFPELWFELPLAGEPWFDLHALTSRDALDKAPLYTDDTQPHYPQLFEWFAQQPGGVRQLALSYDLKAGDTDNPAAQLLVGTTDASVACGFLEAANRPDAVRAYRAFAARLPEDWFACYVGVFPGRPDLNLRVECIPRAMQQQAYAQDIDLLRTHLHQAGFTELGDTILPRCQQLARTPFQLEFQFDISPDGIPTSTLGASVRFACPPGTDDWQPFELDGPAGVLMQQVESWGLADGRWRLFPEATFANNVAFQGSSCKIFNFPAFLKLRWRDGVPLDAKAYFVAGLQ